MPPKIIEVKSWSKYLHLVKDLKKPFEVRRMDRPYEVGAWLHQREYAPREEVGGRGAGDYGDLHVFAPITMVVFLDEVPGFGKDVKEHTLCGEVETALDALARWGVLGLDLRMMQVVRSVEGAEAVKRRILSKELIWTP